MEEGKKEKAYKEIKTADYTRKAINDYQKNKKLITITLNMKDYEKLVSLGIVGAADVRQVLLDYIKEKYND